MTDLAADLREQAETVWRDGRATGGARLVVVAGDHPPIELGLSASANLQPPAPNTRYRAGSLAKVFNALATCRLVAEGLLDLDQPLSTVLPDFAPDGARAPTAAQLLSHTAGVRREPPRGNYFDTTQPTLQDTVESVMRCPLVYPAGTRCKYSNAGPSIVGHAIERLTGRPYAQWIKHNLLDRLGMADSTFAADLEGWDGVPSASIRVAKPNGSFETVAAPRFRLGTAPAGELVSTSRDLGQFLSWLIDDRRRDELLPRELWHRMGRALVPGDFGLGWRRGDVAGHPMLFHGGAIYGFSSLMTVVPDASIGLAVLANEDLLGGLLDDLAEALLARLLGIGPTHAPRRPPPSVGCYEGQGRWCRIDEDGAVSISGQTLRVDCDRAGTWQVRGPMLKRSALFQRTDKAMQIGRELMKPMRPASLPPEPDDLLGLYGPPVCGAIVRRRWGRLFAMLENLYEYRLDPIDDDLFAMPHGMYQGETARMFRDERGRVIAMALGGVRLDRASHD